MEIIKKQKTLIIPVRLIEASKLSITDKFLQYEPQLTPERTLKNLIIKTISKGLKDFYKPIYDPSFDRNGNIVYVPEKTPAIGKSYSWWENTANNFLPECNSRLGSVDDYIAFLAVLLKKLSQDKDYKLNPWREICYDSKSLGNYWDSVGAKEDYEKTGSRKVCGFYDLANVCKILRDSEYNHGYYIVSGAFTHDGIEYPIASINHRYRNNPLSKGVGWIIFDKNVDSSDVSFETCPDILY